MPVGGTFNTSSISSKPSQIRTAMSSSESVLPKQHFFRQPFYAKDGKTRLPQYVAHRGFNKIYPENTTHAFKAAVHIGCHGIETDVQMSRDGVVVISHDSTLNRCFGVDKKISDCDWEYLSTLWTRREPREKMLRVSDLLEFLSSPETEHVWLLLDIKRNNDPNTVIKRIAETINKPGPHSSQPWNLRIVLGCWSSNYFPICNEHLPDFQAALIGYNMIAARRALHAFPNVSFNTHFHAVKGPLGYRFINDIHNYHHHHHHHQQSEDIGRLIFGFVINKPRDIRWAIRSHFDAVLTDDPALYKQIVDSWDDAYAKQHERDDYRVSIGERLYLTGFSVWVALFGWVFPLVYPYLQRFLAERPGVRAGVKGSSSRT